MFVFLYISMILRKIRKIALYRIKDEKIRLENNLGALGRRQ